MANSRIKQRYPFIDMVKGMLIVCLIFHHIISIAKKEVSVDSMMHMAKIDVLYVPYFMQTFFFITGFCSSFNEKFGRFFIKNVKTLLIPLLFFSVLTQTVDWLLWDDDFFYVNVFGKNFPFFVELFWFLSSLFIAKIAMYAIVSISDKRYVQLLFVLIPFFLCICLNGYSFHSFNYFHWHNAFVNLAFLWFGYYCKESDVMSFCFKRKYLTGGVYIIGVITFLLLGKHIPYYTHFPHFVLKHALAFIFFTLSGTFMILQLGKLLPWNKHLAFLGQNTIVVYGIHFSLLSVVVYTLSSVFSPQNLMQGTLFYLLTGIITLFFSYVGCLLFQRKPFNYFLGRF